MDMNFFITEVIPIKENQIKVKMMSNVNPKLKVIPYSIINFFTRKVTFQQKFDFNFFLKFGIKIFETLVSKATKNFDKSPWFKAAALEANQDFYKWLETSILPFLKK